MEPLAPEIKHNPATTAAGRETNPSETTNVQGHRNTRPQKVGGADGTVDRVFKRKHKGKFTGAIFIHAGAGFHSHQNERVHLEACSEYVDSQSFMKLMLTLSVRLPWE